MTQTAPLRVTVFSEARIYREAIASILSRRCTPTVIGPFDTSPSGLEHGIELRPDVIVLEITTRRSIRIVSLLTNHAPSAKIVFIASKRIERELRARLSIRGAAFVPPEGSEDDLVDAIAQTLHAETDFSEQICEDSDIHLRVTSSPHAPATKSRVLTHREREVLGFIQVGMSNKEIARVLRISNATVKNHVHNVLSKYRVHRRGKAAALLRDREN